MCPQPLYWPLLLGDYRAVAGRYSPNALSMSNMFVIAFNMLDGLFATTVEYARRPAR